jgi:hypothetical protein
MMDRRSFLKGLGITSVAGTFSIAGGLDGGAAVNAQAQAQLSHPLERLTDIHSLERLRLNPNKFNLVFVMTAQESYSNCGAVIGSIYMLSNEAFFREKVNAVVIMPRVADQSNTSDTANLARLQSLQGQGGSVVTGALDDVRNAVESLDGGFLEFDGNGKVSGHTQEAFFLSPSGRDMFRHRGDDYFTIEHYIHQMVAHCDRRRRDICL